MKIAKVFVNQPLKQIDKPYDYLCPDTVLPGMRVLLTFGKSKTETDGMVVAVRDSTDYQGEIKPVLAVIDDAPVLRPYQIKLCLKMARRYCCRFYDGLSHFTAPVKLVKNKTDANLPTIRAYRSSDTFFHLTRTGENAQTKGKIMGRLIEFLKQGDASSAEINRSFGSVSSSLKSLEAKGWVERYNLDIGDPFYPTALPPLPADEPAEDDAYLAATKKKADPGNRSVYLTGDDSAAAFQLMCRVARDTINASGKALIIVPQIETRRRLCKAFNDCFGRTGAIYSASLSQREKYRVYAGVKNGRIRVVLGNMSALFLPFDRLDDIMILEPGDESFFSEASPHFRAMEVVRDLATLTGAKTTIYEAAPSAEAYHACHTGQYDVVSLALKSSGESPKLVDMKRELRAGNLSVFSRDLTKAMKDALRSGKHVLLIFNRRGYDTYLFCRDCGRAVKCPLCGTVLKVSSDGAVYCPSCGQKQHAPEICPDCGSPRVKAQGLGIEKIEEQLKTRYAHVLRIEGERSLAKRKKLSAYDFEHPTVILGTRALIGYELSDVGLAAAILIDIDLNAGKQSDIVTLQTTKRFFNLSAGKKIIQTYIPEHAVNMALTAGNPRAFYSEELDYRRALGYPPFGTLYYVVCFGKNDFQVKKDSVTVYEALRSSGEEKVFKPVFHRRRAGTGDAEYHILIKTNHPDRTADHIRQTLSSSALSRLYAKTTIFVNPPWSV